MAPKDNLYFAIIAPGFESICAAELSALGIVPEQIEPGGVSFRGGLRELYLANLWLRSASRILVRLGDLTARDFPTLYQRLVRLPWGRFVKPGQACDFKVSCRNSRLTHSGRIADTCREAMAKALGGSCQEGDARLAVFIRLVDDRCTVSVDSSGALLHRRGYRQAHGAAPLRETLAAGCLLACGYDGSRPLLDLMTGSGTFAIEAALIAQNRAPGATRSFAFMIWPKYRAGLWQQLLDEAHGKARAHPAAAIIGVDNNPKVLAAARLNLAQSELQEVVELRCCDMRDVEPPAADGLLICNPPYGERLGKNALLSGLYAQLGQIYAQRFSSWQGAILCPDNRLIRGSGIAWATLLQTVNGGIKVSLFGKG